MAFRHVCVVDSMRILGGAELWALDAVRDLPSRGWSASLIARPGSPLAAEAGRRGLEVDAVPIRFDGAPWTLLKLARVLRRRRAGAVLCITLKDLKAAGVAARLCGVPVVLQSRESDFPLRRRPYYRWYYNRVATGVLVNSEATRRTTLLSAPWLDPSRVRLLYKGIDTQAFSPGPELPADGSSGRRPAAGFVGQLTRRKGLPELMRAWEIIESEGRDPAPRLLIAGEGPLAAPLRRWRGGLRRPDLVEILGFVADMPGFMRGLDVLAAPSRTEGFGLAVAEAAACGVPVAAAAASSLPELVVDGETGLLFPPGDPPALAAALGGLLDDPVRAARMGAAGRARVAGLFDRETMLDRLALMLEPAGPSPRPAEEKT